jgi:tetratricopeptide (TPR) repeat protein
MVMSVEIRNVMVLSVLWACVGIAGPARAAQDARPQDVLVLVMSHVIEGNIGGLGTVIGDGSLIVAVRSAVVGRSTAGGQHRLAGCVTAASPYLGDVVEVEIVTVDEATGLVLLRTPWRGHPALRFADGGSIMDAERLVVIAMPAVASLLHARIQNPWAGRELFQETDAGVDYVAVREGRPVSVYLAANAVSCLWTGAPILLPDRRRLAGVQVFAFADRQSEGPTANLVEELVTRQGEVARLVPGEPMPRPESAQGAFLLYIRIWRSLTGKRQEQMAVECRRFLELRPNCSYGYTLAALAAEELGRMPEADQWHQKALRLAPDSVMANARYADFLDNRDRLDEAMQVIKRLWERAEVRPYLSNVVYSVLDKRREYARCLQLVHEALAVEPNNAIAWHNIGNCRNSQGDYSGAADAFARAGELRPEESSTREMVAINLMKARRWGEAEEQYRRAVAVEPNNAGLHHGLAYVLAQHRPESREEALQEARLARDLYGANAADRKRAENLIKKLESRRD